MRRLVASITIFSIFSSFCASLTSAGVGVIFDFGHSSAGVDNQCGPFHHMVDSINSPAIFPREIISAGLSCVDTCRHWDCSLCSRIQCSNFVIHFGSTQN